MWSQFSKQNFGRTSRFGPLHSTSPSQNAKADNQLAQHATDDQSVMESALPRRLCLPSAEPFYHIRRGLAPIQDFIPTIPQNPREVPC